MDFPKPSRSSERTVRLQKYLADCGVGSRRACERLIDEGRVTLDALPVSGRGICIEPQRVRVCVDGKPVKPQKLVYLLLNKPRGYLCTSRDEKGRATIHDLLPALGIRVYNVGRLDRDSEGLVLVTNDGALAARLTHPRHQIKKVYRVWTDRPLERADEDLLKEGVCSGGDLLRAASVSREPAARGAVCYRVDLLEGKNRQIRRMFEAVGRPVSRLVRIGIGPLTLGSLQAGQWRRLTAAELERLGS